MRSVGGFTGAAPNDADILSGFYAVTFFYSYFVTKPTIPHVGIAVRDDYHFSKQAVL